MSLMVVLLGSHRAAPVLGPDVVSDLVRVGVTDISVATGADGTALVLTGWSFDSRRNERHVLELVSAADAVAVMHGVADVTLLPDHQRPPDEGPLSPDGSHP